MTQAFNKNTSSRLNKGFLEILIGPMQGGKTTEGVRIATVKSTKYKVLFISQKSSLNRHTLGGDGKSFTSHNPVLKTLPDNVDHMVCHNLSSVSVDNYEVIIIDESNFFGDLIPSVNSWINDKNKHVVVIGLDGSYKQTPLGDVINLIPLCDTVRKLNAECHLCAESLKSEGINCSSAASNAPFTHKLKDDGNIISIGGSEMYIPVCRYHMNSLKH